MASLQKLAGAAVLKPIYEFILGGEGLPPKKVKNSLRWRGETSPSIAPRLIMDTKQSDSPNPICVYSDATGEGGLISLTFLSIPESPAPLLLIGQAQGKLHRLVFSRSDPFSDL